MPGWQMHVKWSRKIGIPDDIAKYTNRVIDVWKLEDYPEDFAKYIYEKKFPRPKGRKPFSLADFLIIFGTHDLRKLKKETLPYFQIKGKDYVKTWYLHHILDYLVKLRSWMENTGENTKKCIDKYQKNKAVTVSETEKQLIEVTNFLKSNTEELQKDLNLPNKT